MCQLEHEVTYVYVHTRRQGLSEVEIHGCWHGHACDSSPCQNGGVCHERPYSYACRCPRGYSGDRCCEQNTSIVPAESCAHLLNHSRSTTNCGDSLRSGTVQVRSVGRTTAPAYCDVQRHGGGWQLVGLSNGGRTAIWGGLGGQSDRQYERSARRHTGLLQCKRELLWRVRGPSAHPLTLCGAHALPPRMPAAAGGVAAAMRRGSQSQPMAPRVKGFECTIRQRRCLRRYHRAASWPGNPRLIRCDDSTSCELPHRATCWPAQGASTRQRSRLVTPRAMHSAW